MRLWQAWMCWCVLQSGRGGSSRPPPTEEEEARAIEESKRRYITVRSNTAFLNALKERRAKVTAGSLRRQDGSGGERLLEAGEAREALDYVDTEIARVTHEIARDTLEQDRVTRILLLKRMREVEAFYRGSRTTENTLDILRKHHVSHIVVHRDRNRVPSEVLAMLKPVVGDSEVMLYQVPKD